MLIVGAGSGTDVAVALAHGAGHIDAVEIDPEIAQIGIDEHPDHPYQDPRVTRHINDGRAFLRNTTTKYDLVVFALPDSLTLVSTTANLRLESFLFTEQAFASVSDHLAPNGVFVLYNYYRQDWLITKLANMLTASFGARIRCVHTYQVGTASVMAAMADGPGVAALPGGKPPGDTVTPIPDAGRRRRSRPRTTGRSSTCGRRSSPTTTTRRWASCCSSRWPRSAWPARSPAPACAASARTSSCSAVAFLLLETRSLVSFSLLFGTTWLVNALAFFAILASVLLAIFINARFPIKRPHLLYAGLFIALADRVPGAA